MLDVFHIPDTQGYDVQYYEGLSSTTVRTWHTWRKPRGVKMVYIIAVGGGSSGGCGTNTAATSGGGAGGGSGAQSILMIPAMFVPDVLFVQPGQGGQQPATLVSGAAGVAGTPTYVCITPDSTLNVINTLVVANNGQATGAATTTAGGTAGTAAVVGSLATMPLAGRGVYNFLVGQAGSAGGANTPAAGGNVTFPVTGLHVTGGTGGGGSAATGAAAGNMVVGTAPLGGDFWPQSTGTASTTLILGGIAAVTSTPAGEGKGGLILKNNIMRVGGVGGGGATTTAGGVAGGGGNGAPGCGGGGAGGSNTTNATLARPGNGGPGFVYILSW